MPGTGLNPSCLPGRGHCRRLRHQQGRVAHHGGRSMHDIWRQEAGDGGSGGNVAGRQLLDAARACAARSPEADEQAAAAQARYAHSRQ